MYIYQVVKTFFPWKFFLLSVGLEVTWGRIWEILKWSKGDPATMDLSEEEG